MEVRSKEALEKLSIGDLRIVGRQIGVKAPCSRSKADLVEAIMDVSTGKVAPTTETRGRPSVAILSPIVSMAVGKIQEPAPQPTTETEEPPLDLPSLLNGEDVEEQPKEPTDELPEVNATGVLQIMAEGYGFLRVESFNPNGQDVYVPPVQIRRFSLRDGDKIECRARLFKDKALPSLIFIFKINDSSCEEYVRRNVRFDDLVSCYPSERITLEREKNEYSLRLIDLVAPIGKGQRGLIVAAPKTGKTILLKKIAQAVRINNPEIHVTVLLIDERPEEVTDFKQNVDCEVAYSTFDQSPTHHVQTAELVLSNAKRRVELGQDVMILMDSITRLGRAYNQVAATSGRTMTGGLDISALQEPKRFFGAGRNIVGKGSLTILATALIDTGSKMDDIIYEEFKGTGNMEIHLDRRMSEKRIFPAIDLAKSGTRREEMLLTQSQLECMWMIRRALSRTDTISATEQLLDILMGTSNNDEFINVLKIMAQRKKV